MYTNYSVLPQLYQSNGLAADSQLFVCRDNRYFYFGVSSRDHAVVTALCICFCIQSDAKVTQVAADLFHVQDLRSLRYLL